MREEVNGEGRNPEPLVNVLIVAWNEVRFLPLCLEALRRQTYACYDVTIIDNASKDGSAEWANEQSGPDVRVIHTGADLGFCKAVNIGIRATSGPIVLNLSPDVMLEPDYIASCVGVLQLADDVGIVGGKLLRPSLEFQPALPARIDSAGHEIRATGRVFERGHDEPDSGQYDREEDVFGVTAAACLLRRATIEDIAFEDQVFDEDFWGYKDDVDVCWRAGRRGWRTRYVPAAVAWHRRGFTSAGLSPVARRRIARVLRFHSFRNHFLVLAHNARIQDLLVCAPALIAMELAFFFYIITFERDVLGAYGSALRAMPRAMSLRRAVVPGPNRTPVRAARLGW